MPPKVVIRDLKSRKPIKHFLFVGKRSEETTSISLLSFSPDGKRLVVGCFGELELWDIASKTINKRFTSRPFRRSGIAAFFPDGRQMIINSLPDKVVRRWDVATGKQAGLAAYGRNTYTATLSPDVRTLNFWGRATLNLPAFFCQTVDAFLQSPWFDS